MKTPFLEKVTDDLLSHCKGHLEYVNIVFPNKRARLFMNNYLMSKAGNKPFWEPKYSDINELFATASNLIVADPIELIFYLYQSFCTVYKERYGEDYNESFDEFYFFGEILLHDFDDVDTSCVNAKELFSNITDLAALESDFSFLDDSQKEVIHKFFGMNLDGASELKQRYFKVWDILYAVYAHFRAQLRDKGLAYPGMVARDAVEKLASDQDAIDLLFSDKLYVFVGFNVLKECEHKLLRALKHKARFYWDCDRYFMDCKAQEAGRFLRKDIEDFPNALPMENNLCQLSNVTIVEAPSDMLQTAYIPKWLEDLKEESFAKPDSAIVFGKEKLLASALRNFPADFFKEKKDGGVEANTINITMGFPLAQTPVYAFLQLIFKLVGSYSKTKDNVLMEHLIAWLDHAYSTHLLTENDTVRKEIVDTHLFRYPLNKLEEYGLGVLCQLVRCESSAEFAAHLCALLKQLSVGVDDLSPLYKEALFQVYHAINRLCSVLNGLENESKGVEPLLGKTIFVRFLQRLMSAQSIPYHGEPEKGLQLMGVLETRNMDFKNLLLLSVNEGVMPKAPNTTSSFIPNFLRRAFRMNHSEHQDSLYAYHFYHLLQRAENVTLVYCKGKEEGTKSEVSRFVLQLLAEHPKAAEFKQIQLQPNFSLEKVKIDKVEKTEEMVKVLKKKRYTPSSINSYVDCPLKFYYESVVYLRDEMNDLEEMDDALMGSIFHGAMENIYKSFRKNAKNGTAVTITEVMVNAMLDKRNESKLDAEICKAFNEHYFSNANALTYDEFNGEQKVYFAAVKKFVIRQLRFDLMNAPFESISLEEEYNTDIELADGTKVRVGGTVDRLDQKNGVYLLKDYKTSSHAESPKEIGDHLDKGCSERPYRVAQLFVYSEVLTELGCKSVKPILLYPRTFNANAAFSDADIKVVKDKKAVVVDDYAVQVREEFLLSLKNVLSEILDLNMPFEAHNGHCKFCAFHSICSKYKPEDY